MNRPSTPDARSWLAPATALLFLAGLVAPAVAAGPLDGPVPTPVGGAASNLLTLKADGSIVSWLDAGSNRTTIHIQGVQTGAGGFNLADPYGRFIGADQSSTAAGFVDFTGLHLLRGTYTFLGPNAGPAMVLARFDLASFGTENTQAFASPVNATASHRLASAIALVCQDAPPQGMEVAKMHLWARGYGSACAVGLDGAPGCLLAVDVPCVWATAWAWAAKYCPNSCTAAAQEDSGPCTLQWQDCTLVNQVYTLVMGTVGPVLDNIKNDPCTQDATSAFQCTIEQLATEECYPGSVSEKTCQGLQLIAQLVLYIQNEGIPNPPGGGGIPGIPAGVDTCTTALVGCATPDSTSGTDPWASGSYTTIKHKSYYSVDGTVTMFGRIDQLVSESDPNFDYYAISNYLKQGEKADFSNAYLTTYFGQNAPTYPEELDWSPGFSQVSRPTDFGVSLGAGGASFNVGWTQSWSGNWEITDRWSPQTQGDFAYYAHRDHFNPDSSGNPWNTLAQGNLWRVAQGTTLDVLFEGQIHVGWWPFDRTEYSGLQSFWTWNSTCGSSTLGISAGQSACVTTPTVVPNPPVPAGPGA